MGVALLAGCSGSISEVGGDGSGDTYGGPGSNRGGSLGNGNGNADGVGDGDGDGDGPGSGDGDGSPGSVVVDCDGSDPIAAEHELQRITKTQYTNAIRDIFDGKVSASQAFPATIGDSETGFSTEAVLNAPSEQKIQQIMMAADDVAESLVDALPSLLPCSTSGSPNDACVDTFIDKYARRAFRRDPSDAERGDLMATFRAARSDGATFSESVAIVANLMLQMPQFLYIAEEAAPEARPLTSIEMASRLSFMLWDSIPDEELLVAAENDELSTLAQVADQAERMLASPKADESIARFVREWTGTKQVNTADKDTATYPYFTRDYAQSMNESFDRFVVGVVRDNGTLDDLLRSPKAQVDENMADFFGVDAPSSGWSEVSLDADRYTGIMTQPALLASLAHTIDASYVYRGVFLRKRLLCTQIGGPPANATAEFTQIPLPDNPTGKEKSAAVQARNPCGSCHSLMDPLGLSLEKFDGLGHFREEYSSGRAIDPAGSVLLDSGETLEFADQVEMMQALSEEPAVRACFATQVFRFALSRAETKADACSVRHVQEELDASGGDVASALVSITTSDAFRYRIDNE